MVSILWIGLIAGTLDITENLVFNLFRGITPWRVFQYIASGLIGTQAFQSGWSSVVLGVILHYAIALIWTAIFYVACSRVAIIAVFAFAHQEQSSWLSVNSYRFSGEHGERGAGS
jgi:hypothetical protein